MIMNPYAIFYDLWIHTWVHVFEEQGSRWSGTFQTPSSLWYGCSLSEAAAAAGVAAGHTMAQAGPYTLTRLLALAALVCRDCDAGGRMPWSHESRPGPGLGLARGGTQWRAYWLMQRVSVFVTCTSLASGGCRPSNNRGAAWLSRTYEDSA